MGIEGLAGNCMRIIAGKYRGRRIKTVKGQTVRPTADRVREAIFSILGETVKGASVLDLFAGSGALGLEALSRGASFVLFVEKKPAVAKIIRHNIKLLDARENTEVCHADVRKFIKAFRDSRRRFDLVFADPPYKRGLAEQTLLLLGEGEILNDRAVVVVEHERSCRPASTYGCLNLYTFKTYGDTAVSFYSTA